MSALKPLKKAVLPVAGLGTRFLPATKAMPKEMLPVVDQPLIQYARRGGARRPGIEEFIFVTGRDKPRIEDHFDRAYELDETLAGSAARPRELEELERPADQAGRRGLHPPAGAAGPRPRGLVRARTWSATSRSRCCWPTT